MGENARTARCCGLMWVCRQDFSPRHFNPLRNRFPSKRCFGVLLLEAFTLFLHANSHCFCSCFGELLFIMPFNNVAYGLYRVAERSVMNASVLGVDLGRLGGDEALGFKTVYVLLHAIAASSNGLANRRVTGIAPKGFTILAPHQIGIDQDLTVGKIQIEDGIGDGEVIRRFGFM